jgi:hypothetical protein
MMPLAVSRHLRGWQSVFRLKAAERAIRSPVPGQGAHHGLAGELIVSLTSYGPRLGTVVKTVRSILLQGVIPDRVVLWVTPEDFKSLPQDLLSLTGNIFEVRTFRDLKSYMKIIPALETWPEAFIITADDDLYYEPNWLGILVRGAVAGEKIIVCRRAHRPRRSGDRYAPYAEWDWDIVTRGEVRDDLFPTGCGGVLYPPGSLSPEVGVEGNFKKLCPTADDVWLYWMGRLAGSRVRQVGGGFAQVPWAGSQECSLISQNAQGRNDEQLRAVMAAYPIDRA